MESLLPSFRPTPRALRGGERALCGPYVIRSNTGQKEGLRAEIAPKELSTGIQGGTNNDAIDWVALVLLHWKVND